MLRFGAKNIPRVEYITRLGEALSCETLKGSWARLF